MFLLGTYMQFAVTCTVQKLGSMTISSWQLHCRNQAELNKVIHNDFYSTILSFTECF